MSILNPILIFSVLSASSTSGTKIFFDLLKIVRFQPDDD